MLNNFVSKLSFATELLVSRSLLKWKSALIRHFNFLWHNVQITYTYKKCIFSSDTAFVCQSNINHSCHGALYPLVDKKIKLSSQKYSLDLISFHSKEKSVYNWFFLFDMQYADGGWKEVTCRLWFFLQLLYECLQGRVQRKSVFQTIAFRHDKSVVEYISWVVYIFYIYVQL